MRKLTPAEFEKMVKAGIGAIPERFLRRLANVAIVIEDEPTPEQKRKMELREDEELFGLYEGVPLAERGSNYTGVLPDKITIFKKPIKEEAESREEITEIVRDTVWHEIAHHFGMDEPRVEEAERRRAKKMKG